MFNPEKLLGALIRSGMRRGSGSGNIISGGAMLGLLGVAMEAAEHFMNRPAGSPPGGAPPPPPGPTRMPPQPKSGGTGGPPPPPAAGTGMTPPPPPGVPAAPAEAGQRAEDAILLIRAMIAAANADGVIDQAERTRIFERLQDLQLTPQDQAFLMNELLNPQNADEIAGKARSRHLARQVYEVSLLAIDPDTENEQRYLHGLAHKLELSETEVHAAHRALEQS